MPDRFSSDEEVEWAKGAFDDGSYARIIGSGVGACPSESIIGHFAVKSWRAGWADADASLAADPQEWDHFVETNRSHTTTSTTKKTG